MRGWAGPRNRRRTSLARRVQQIAIRPVLDHVAEGIAPVVVDLAADIVTPNAPVVRVFLLAQVLVAGPRLEGSALYLAANGCEVTAVESEVSVVNRKRQPPRANGCSAAPMNKANAETAVCIVPSGLDGKKWS